MIAERINQLPTATFIRIPRHPHRDLNALHNQLGRRERALPQQPGLPRNSGNKFPLPMLFGPAAAPRRSRGGSAVHRSVGHYGIRQRPSRRHEPQPRSPECRNTKYRQLSNSACQIPL